METINPTCMCKDDLGEKICQSMHGMSRLELSKKVGLIPSNYVGKLCYNTDGECDDDRCRC